MYPIASDAAKRKDGAMAEYEQTVKINAEPDAVFDFVSDVSNLPKYLPTTRHAETNGPDRVRVQGDVRGHSYDSDGFMTVDPVDYHMEWGSDGENQYRGSLDVEDAGDGTCDVTVHLSFTPRPDMARQMDQSSGDHDTAIHEGIAAALQSIKNIVEGHGVKIEPQAVK